jgi:site-specific recombinase XerD
MALLDTDSTPTTGAVGPASWSATDAGLVGLSLPPASDRHPVAVYLASLAVGSCRTIRQALNVVASMISANASAMDLPWERVGYQHVAAVRTRLAETYAPTTANKMMAGVKWVVRQAFALGMIDAETLARIGSVKSIKGARVPKGRAVSQSELTGLFAVCDMTTAGGARDAALLGSAYGAGLRRSEIVGRDVADYERRTGALDVRGKGNRERTGYTTNGARNAPKSWLAIRGDEPGPLFFPVNKAGRIIARRMTDQAVYCCSVVSRSGRKSPRSRPTTSDVPSLAISLMQAPISVTVQALAAHGSVATTARYDRRPERTRRRAAELLHVPFEA